MPQRTHQPQFAWLIFIFIFLDFVIFVSFVVKFFVAFAT
jgi:hypothetical protein